MKLAEGKKEPKDICARDVRVSTYNSGKKVWSHGAATGFPFLLHASFCICVCKSHDCLCMYLLTSPVPSARARVRGTSQDAEVEGSWLAGAYFLPKLGPPPLIKFQDKSEDEDFTDPLSGYGDA